MKIKYLFPFLLLPLLHPISFFNGKNENYINRLLFKTNLFVNDDVKFIPIEENYYPYSNNLSNLVNVGFENKYQNKKFNFSTNLFVIDNDIKTINKKLIQDSIKNIDYNFLIKETPYIDFYNSDILLKENEYLVTPYNNVREYDILLKCGKKHSTITYDNCKYSSVSSHTHSYSCIKTIYYDCNGCIKSKETISSNIHFKNSEYNKFLRMQSINLDEFDLGYLIKIDEEKSIKSFDKTILHFSFNKKWIRNLILKSFNYSYATYFFKTSWINDKKIKNLISSSIAENKIIPFFEEIPKYFQFNEINYDKKHNLMYWLENYDNLSYDEIKEGINSLQKLDFDLYDEYNISYFDEYIGFSLFKLLNNENYLKSIIYKITYKLGRNGPIKTQKISLFDLLNNQNNKIIYDFKDNIDSNNYEDQSIIISNVKMYVNKKNNIIDEFEGYNSGFVDNKNNLLKPIVSNSETNYFFNKKSSYASLIKEKNIILDESKNFLIRNNIFGYPSKNVNEYVAFNLMDLNTFLKFDDNAFQNGSSLHHSLLNDKYKKFIKNYKLIPFDSKGIMRVYINFIDDTSITYDVSGFDQYKDISIKTLEKEINFENIDLSGIEKIDEDIFLNKYISYNNKINENSLFCIDLSFEDFKANVYKNILFEKNINEFVFVLCINEDNITKKYYSKIKNKIQNDNYNHNDNNNFNDKNIKKNVIKILLIIIVFLIPLIYFLIKYRKNIFNKFIYKKQKI